MFVIFLVNSLIVALVVLIHYECLSRFTLIMERLSRRHRARILVGVFGALLGHAAEIWIFALAYYFMHRTPGWGSFQGNFDGSLLDCAYFSFTTYTTLGYGDIEPLAEVRYLTGIESLTGFVLITWTASFLFLEMQRSWRH